MLPVSTVHDDIQDTAVSQGMNLRGNTSGAELASLESVRELADRVSRSGEDVQEERRGDVVTSNVLNLLKGGGEAVLVGARPSARDRDIT